MSHPGGALSYHCVSLSAFLYVFAVCLFVPLLIHAAFISLPTNLHTCTSSSPGIVSQSLQGCSACYHCLHLNKQRTRSKSFSLNRFCCLVFRPANSLPACRVKLLPFSSTSATFTCHNHSHRALTIGLPCYDLFIVSLWDCSGLWMICYLDFLQRQALPGFSKFLRFIQTAAG